MRIEYVPLMTTEKTNNNFFFLRSMDRKIRVLLVMAEINKIIEWIDLLFSLNILSKHLNTIDWSACLSQHVNIF